MKDGPCSRSVAECPRVEVTTISDMTEIQADRNAKERLKTGLFICYYFDTTTAN